jgi:hypothetical protein
MVKNLEKVKKALDSDKPQQFKTIGDRIRFTDQYIWENTEYIH